MATTVVRGVHRPETGIYPVVAVDLEVTATVADSATVAVADTETDMMITETVAEVARRVITGTETERGREIIVLPGIIFAQIDDPRMTADMVMVALDYL